MSDIREELAEYAHDAWSGWMKYLFSKCTFDSNGGARIPSWALERWKRQSETKYSDLPEIEKYSDRDEADKIINIIAGARNK